MATLKQRVEDRINFTNMIYNTNFTYDEIHTVIWNGHKCVSLDYEIFHKELSDEYQEELAFSGFIFVASDFVVSVSRTSDDYFGVDVNLVFLNPINFEEINIDDKINNTLEELNRESEEEE